MFLSAGQVSRFAVPPPLSNCLVPDRKGAGWHHLGRGEGGVWMMESAPAASATTAARFPSARPGLPARQPPPPSLPPPDGRVMAGAGSSPQAAPPLLEQPDGLGQRDPGTRRRGGGVRRCMPVPVGEVPVGPVRVRLLFKTRGGDPAGNHPGGGGQGTSPPPPGGSRGTEKYGSKKSPRKVTPKFFPSLRPDPPTHTLPPPGGGESPILKRSLVPVHPPSSTR